MTNFYHKCYKYMKDYPQHADEIKDAYEQTMDEIQDGGSQEHEIELCLAYMEDIVHG